SLQVNASPDDASQALGASYAFLYDRCRQQKKDAREYLQPLSSAYLGPQLDTEAIPALLKKIDGKKYRVRKNAAPQDIAKLLAAGKVIARAAGRSEFGARALGNRSIIADPRNYDIVAVINEKIKSRDFWMPFAASILEKRAHDYLVNFSGHA